jgi:hypothetical protein
LPAPDCACTCSGTKHTPYQSPATAPKREHVRFRRVAELCAEGATVVHRVALRLPQVAPMSGHRGRARARAGRGQAVPFGICLVRGSFDSHRWTWGSVSRHVACRCFWQCHAHLPARGRANEPVRLPA